jgi:hypothetical protein
MLAGTSLRRPIAGNCDDGHRAVGPRRVDSTRGLLTYPPQKPHKLTFCQSGANVCIFY